MGKQQNQRQPQKPVSANIEIGQRSAVPGLADQVTIRVFTTRGEVRCPWTINEIGVNNQVLLFNVQTSGRNAECATMYPLVSGETTIKVTVRYHNGKEYVVTENVFTVPKPETPKAPKATQIILGTPVFSDGLWQQGIRTVDDDGKPVEETVEMDLTIATLVSSGDDNQHGSDLRFNIIGGSAYLYIESARWYFEVTYSLPGGAGSVKQQYLEPENL